MVSWGWIPIAFLVGVCVGILLIGLVAANRQDEEMMQHEKRTNSL